MPRHTSVFAERLDSNDPFGFEHRRGKSSDFFRDRDLRKQVSEATLGRLGGQHFGHAQARESATMVA